MNQPRSLTIDGLSVDFQPAESHKPAFVFVHGNTQNSSCGKGLLEYFSQQGHSTLSYDLPGHGNSDWGPYDYDFNDLIELNYQVINKYQLDKPILCGHSLGGMMQAGTIAKYQFIPTSLILCGSYDRYPLNSIPEDKAALKQEMADYLAEYIRSGSSLFKKQRYYDYFENRALDDAFIEIINRRYNQPKASAINLTSLAEFDVRESLSSMKVPTLVIHGEDETVIPKILVEEMKPHYQTMIVEWLSGVGHNGFYQSHEKTVAILNRHYTFITGY